MRANFERYQPTEVRRAFADFVRLHALFFEVSDTDVRNVQPLCRDPKDNQFLALLQVCDADVLISSDADLLVLHPWNAIPIMTPAAFLGTVNTH